MFAEVYLNIYQQQ